MSVRKAPAAEWTRVSGLWQALKTMTLVRDMIEMSAAHKWAHVSFTVKECSMQVICS